VLLSRILAGSDITARRIAVLFISTEAGGARTQRRDDERRGLVFDPAARRAIQKVEGEIDHWEQDAALLLPLIQILRA
jgi:hypothetical protein